MKTYMKMMENRKELVKRLSQLAGIKAEYTKMPRCAFLVGDYAVERGGMLTVPDDADMEPIETLLTEGMIREYDPEAEAKKAEEQKRLKEAQDQEDKKVDVSFPIEGHKAESLKNLAVMVCNRGNLISKATGGHFSCSPEFVEILSSANSVADFKTIVKEHGGLEGIDITDRGYFTGFPDIADRNSIQAFTQLASRMNSISMEQGTMRMKQADAENEKFSFRIWLLGLGMKGEEYKTARRILLAPLKGNTAFRTDEIRESFRARQKAKRESERRRS